MKRIASLVSLLLLAVWLAPASARAGTELKTPEQQYSYSFGRQLGQDIKRIPGGIDTDALLLGIKDQLQDHKPRITAEQEGLARADFQKKVQKEKERLRDLLSERNMKEGRAFLATNKKKKGVTATASGLQYEVLKKGSGPRPGKDSTVEVHYRGTLLNGTEFDSSYKRGQTVTFPLSKVIPGWVEGLQLMPAGSKYRFYIPSSLAYGKTGAPPKIEPGSTLTFEVELIKVVK